MKHRLWGSNANEDQSSGHALVVLPVVGFIVSLVVLPVVGFIVFLGAL